MKKKVITALIFAFVMGFSVSAMAYTIEDTTLVQPWKDNAPTGAPFTDVIGDPTIFDTLGADLSGNYLTLYTNYSPAKNGSVSPLTTTADLFLDTDNDGLWNIAVRLDTVGQGNVYDANSFKTSSVFFGATGLTYGGIYGSLIDQKDPAVEATGALLGTTSVVWTLNAINEVEVNLSGLVGPGPYTFFWGTATCSNDGFAGNVVPVPSSVLFLGSGLLGLMGLGIRKKI